MEEINKHMKQTKKERQEIDNCKEIYSKFFDNWKRHVYMGFSKDGIYSIGITNPETKNTLVEKYNGCIVDTTTDFSNNNYFISVLTGIKGVAIRELAREKINSFLLKEGYTSKYFQKGFDWVNEKDIKNVEAKTELWGWKFDKNNWEELKRRYFS